MFVGRSMGFSYRRLQKTLKAANEWLASHFNLKLIDINELPVVLIFAVLEFYAFISGWHADTQLELFNIKHYQT